jgi:AraC-like DNA-binding protein
MAIKLSRADALLGYGELVSALGGDAGKLLAAAGLPAEVLDDPDMLISRAAIASLLERSATVLHCPDFGMRLAARQGIDILGPLALEIRNCPTVADALASVSKYVAAIRPGLEVTTESDRRAGTTFVRVSLVTGHAGNISQLLELTMSVAQGILTLLSGGQAKALRISFEHGSVAALASYQAIFGVNVRFNCEHSGFLFRSADLALPIANGDPLLHKIAQAYLDTHFAAPDTAVTARIRALVPTLLAPGMCHHIRVAKTIGLHPRTMQRRLSEEGTSFAAIVDEVRYELAQRFLGQAHVPLNRIAELLGYTEPSVFSRSCRRWFGATPSELRRRAQSKNN